MTEADMNQIIKTVELKATIERVWTALTDFREFGSWFRVALDQPFEPGKISTGQMTYPGAEGLRWIAYIEDMKEGVEGEYLFSFRWYDSDEGSGEETDEEPSLHVSFHLEEISGGTRLTITESGFAALPEARRIELMRGNREGWDIQTVNLTVYLSK